MMYPYIIVSLLTPNNILQEERGGQTCTCAGLSPLKTLEKNSIIFYHNYSVLSNFQVLIFKEFLSFKFWFLTIFKFWFLSTFKRKTHQIESQGLHSLFNLSSLRSIFWNNFKKVGSYVVAGSKSDWYTSQIIGVFLRHNE